MAGKGEYHDNFATVQAAAGGRLDRDIQNRLFDRLDWLESLHRLALRKMPLLIAHASAHGHDMWLPLLSTGGGRYQALSNWYSFTWAPLFGGDYDEVTRLSLLSEIAKRMRQYGRCLSLAPMPDEDGSATLLATSFEQSGWYVVKTACDENHYLRLNGRNFDEYWQGRPGQLRNTVKRKGKKGVVSIRIEREFNPDSWKDYERIYARSWKPSEGNPNFLKALAQREGDAGCLRIGLAYIDGHPVAAQFWTVENGIALIHKLAHDERHLSASPGTLLSAALFQHVIDIDKVSEIDFGTGSDPYKAEWMEEMRPRYRLDIYWPNHMANWPQILRHKLRR